MGEKFYIMKVLENKCFRLAIAVMISIGGVACSDKEAGDVALHTRSYVAAYESGAFKLGVMRSTPNQTGKIELLIADPVKCWSPEFASYYNYPNDDARYLEIATRNNDLTYDRMVFVVPQSSICCWADNFRAISVISDTAWDAAHPAGTPLDDIVTARFETIAPFIESGYAGIESKTVMKETIKDLNPKDLKMIAAFYPGNGIEMWFAAPPADPTAEHTLTVTLTTTEGKTYTATGTGIPPVKKPE